MGVGTVNLRAVSISSIFGAIPRPLKVCSGWCGRDAEFISPSVPRKLDERNSTGGNSSHAHMSWLRARSFQPGCGYAVHNPLTPEDSENERCIVGYLEKRRGAGVPEQRSQKTSGGALMIKQMGDIKNRVERKDGDNTQFLEFMDAMRDESCGKHDQKDTGDSEQERQVYPKRETKKDVSEHQCRAYAQDGPDKLVGLPDESARLQIEDRFRSFPEHCRRDKDKNPYAVSSFRMVCDFFFDPPDNIFLPVHPEYHPRNERRGYEH